MSVEAFHGARVFQSAEEPVLARHRDTSVIGLMAAVDPSALPSGYAVNTPFLVLKASDAATLPDDVKQHIDSIFDQVITKIVVNLIDEGADADELTANAVGDFAQRTGIHAFTKATSMGLPRPKLLIAPGGLTTAAAADGIASVSVTTAGSGYTENTSLSVAGDTGQGAEFELIIGTGGAIDGVVVTKPGYGYTGALVFTVTDPDGGGENAVFSGTIGQVMNPVIAEAQGVAEKLRAVFYADGPDGTNAQAVAARQLIGSKRIQFCDPRALKSIGGVPHPRSSSAIWAGMQAKADKLFNVAHSGSNQIVNGIQGTNRPVEYGEEATYLNENGVNTIVNWGDGFRLWGGVTCAVNSIWKFTSVVRVADLVNETIEMDFRQFNDRPQTLGNLDLMVMAGNNALRRLENEGVLLPGSKFWLSEGQTPDDGAQGIVKFGMRYEPPAPIYDLRITAHRNITIGYELLYSSVTGEVQIGTVG